MYTKNYSGSKCPKCDSTFFENVSETPKDSNHKLQFVRCSSCKTVVGVLDSHNISTLILGLAEKLNVPLDK